tara:strand:- start:1339 stop:1746 length:408 start_codon:yes stop_codon:yes gene_type:complete
MFVSRIAQRAKTNLDKIFVQGAKAEEKRQQDLSKAVKEGKKKFPQRAAHDGYNSLRGTTGIVLSWVPENYANAMYNLGADYQIQEKNAHECLEAAQRVAEKVKADLQPLQSIELLNFLRSQDTADDARDEGQDKE